MQFDMELRVRRRLLPRRRGSFDDSVRIVRLCGKGIRRLLFVLHMQAFTTTLGMDQRQHVEPQDSVARDEPIVNIDSFESYSLSLNSSQ